MNDLPPMRTVRTNVDIIRIQPMLSPAVPRDQRYRAAIARHFADVIRMQVGGLLGTMTDNNAPPSGQLVFFSGIAIPVDYTIPIYTAAVFLPWDVDPLVWWAEWETQSRWIPTSQQHMQLLDMGKLDMLEWEAS